ncbi:MAG: hypothetical protein ACRECV_05745 [Xanthobacteraceae bacterium]
MRFYSNESTRWSLIMWQMLLIPLSMVLLVGTLILLSRQDSEKSEPKGRLKIIYPAAISPTQRK